MKKIILLGFLAIAGFSSAALAQVTTVEGAQYREYQAKAVLCNGEVKTATLQVNLGVAKVAMGDPEIDASHGHWDHYLTGTIIEGDKICHLDLLMAQSRLSAGEEYTTYYGGQVKLCSGMSFSLADARALTKDAPAAIEMRAPGVAGTIGSGSLNFSGMKTVPTYEPHDD